MLSDSHGKNYDENNQNKDNNTAADDYVRNKSLWKRQVAEFYRRYNFGKSIVVNGCNITLCSLHCDINVHTVINRVGNKGFYIALTALSSCVKHKPHNFFFLVGSAAPILVGIKKIVAYIWKLAWRKLSIVADILAALIFCHCHGQNNRWHIIHTLKIDISVLKGFHCCVIIKTENRKIFICAFTVPCNSAHTVRHWKRHIVNLRNLVIFCCARTGKNTAKYRYGTNCKRYSSFKNSFHHVRIFPRN